MMYPTTASNKVDDEGQRSSLANVDRSASAYSRKKNDELRCLFENKRRHVSEIVQSLNERGIGRVSLLPMQVDPLLPRRWSLERSVARDALDYLHVSDSSVGKDMIMIDRVDECEDTATGFSDDGRHEDLISPTSVIGMENYLQQSFHNDTSTTNTVTELTSTVPSLSDRKNAIIIDTASTFNHTDAISADLKVVEAKAAKGESQKPSPHNIRTSSNVEKLRTTVEDEVTSLTAALTRIHSVMESKTLGNDDKMDECKTLVKQIEDALVEKQEILNTINTTQRRKIPSITISSGEVMMNKEMNPATKTYVDDNIAIPFQKNVSLIEKGDFDVENRHGNSSDAPESPTIVDKSYNYPSMEEDDNVVESAYLNVIEVLHSSGQDSSNKSVNHHSEELDVSVWSFSAVGKDYDKNASIEIGNTTNIADFDTSDDILTDAEQDVHRCIWKESPQKSLNSFQSDDAVITRIESEPQRMFTVIEPTDVEAEAGPISSNIVVEKLPPRQTSVERHGLRQKGNNIDTIVQPNASTKCGCVIM